MKVPNSSIPTRGLSISLSRLQNEGSQLWGTLGWGFSKSIKATE